jgi:hypothetical protein
VSIPLWNFSVCLLAYHGRYFFETFISTCQITRRCSPESRFIVSGKCYQMSSFSETKAEDLIETSAKDFVAYNTRQLSRIYPSGKRTGSSNYKPTPFWNVGCQIGTSNLNTFFFKFLWVGLLYQPWMIDDDYGAIGGMRIGRGNRSTRRKPAPVPLCPPQIPHDLTWDRTWAAAMGSQRLTA